MTHEINEENIRVAAYYIWEQAGCPEGKDKECWIKACEQLFAAKTPKKAAKKTVKTVAKPMKKVVVKAAVVQMPVKKATVKAKPACGCCKKAEVKKVAKKK